MKATSNIIATERCATLFMFGSLFIFYYFFYRYHFCFQEQYQLLLLTTTYFVDKIGHPGGFADYGGEFFTQLFYLPVAGVTGILFLLLLIQQSMHALLVKIKQNVAFYPLSFIPALFCAVIICNPFYPLSILCGVLTGLTFAVIYMHIGRDKLRWLSAPLFVLLTYWLAGGAQYMLVLLILVYERVTYQTAFRHKEHPGKLLMSGCLFAMLLLAAVVPLLLHRFCFSQPLLDSFFSRSYYQVGNKVPYIIPLLFALPGLTAVVYSLLPIVKKRLFIVAGIVYLLLLSGSLYGFLRWANFKEENGMAYDYFVRHEQWEQAIGYAASHPPRNNLSLAMLNLSLIRTGISGDALFKYRQNELNGLFIVFDRFENIAPMMGNEILYHLGLINSSEAYAFESSENTPHLKKSVRAVKRLAETALIKEEWELARKYLTLLKHTLFYRSWANGMEEEIRANPALSRFRDIRSRQFTKDAFFHMSKIEYYLRMKLEETPVDKTAFEYLMAYYLLGREPEKILDLLPILHNMEYEKIPRYYLEALAFVQYSGYELPPGFDADKADYIRAKEQCQEFMEMTKHPLPALQRKYGDSYWYYFYYK